MKHVRIVFTDREHKRLKKHKGCITWHDYYLSLDDYAEIATREVQA